METHQILNGKVQLYRRGDSRIWQCAASVGGKQRRATTKRDSLSLATEFAEDWYLELRGKDKVGILLSEKSFTQASAQFLREYELITEGERSQKWTDGHEIRLRVHLLPFFGELGVSKVTAGKVQDYRIHRMTSRLEPNPHSRSNRPLVDKPPARSTLHNEIVTLRQVLKTAIRQGWLDHLPDLSAPYRTRARSCTGPGSALPSISDFMKRPALMRANPFMQAINGMRSRCMTMCCFLPTRAFDPMRPETSNTAMLRSSRTMQPARRSWKSKCAASAARGTASRCPVR